MKTKEEHDDELMSEIYRDANSLGFHVMIRPEKDFYILYFDDTALAAGSMSWISERWGDIRNGIEMANERHKALA